MAAGGSAACSGRGRAGPGTPGPRGRSSARRGEDGGGGGAAGRAAEGRARDGAPLPPRHGRALGGAGAAAEAQQHRGARALRCRRHDHPGPLLHVRQDRRQQVGSLPGAAAGRVHRGVRRRAGRGWGAGVEGSSLAGLRAAVGARGRGAPICGAWALGRARCRGSRCAGRLLLGAGARGRRAGVPGPWPGGGRSHGIPGHPAGAPTP